MTGQLVMDQLRMSGTMSAVELMKNGYPTKIPFARIYNKYKSWLDGVDGLDQEFVNSIQDYEFCEIIAEVHNDLLRACDFMA